MELGGGGKRREKEEGERGLEGVEEKLDKGREGEGGLHQLSIKIKEGCDIMYT